MRHTDRYKYGSLNKANEFRIEWNRLCVERDRDRDREGERKAGILIRFCFFCFFVWLFYSPLATVSSEQVNERNVRIVHGIWCACVCRCCRRDDTTENKQSHVAQHEIPNKSKQIPLEENDDGCDAGLAYMHSNCVFCVVCTLEDGAIWENACVCAFSRHVVSRHQQNPKFVFKCAVQIATLCSIFSVGSLLAIRLLAAVQWTIYFYFLVIWSELMMNPKLKNRQYTRHLWCSNGSSSSNVNNRHGRSSRAPNGNNTEQITIIM